MFISLLYHQRMGGASAEAMENAASIARHKRAAATAQRSVGKLETTMRVLLNTFPTQLQEASSSTPGAPVAAPGGPPALSQGPIIRLQLLRRSDLHQGDRTFTSYDAAPQPVAQPLVASYNDPLNKLLPAGQRNAVQYFNAELDGSPVLLKKLPLRSTSRRVLRSHLALLWRAVEAELEAVAHLVQRGYPEVLPLNVVAPSGIFFSPPVALPAAGGSAAEEVDDLCGNTLPHFAYLEYPRDATQQTLRSWLQASPAPTKWELQTTFKSLLETLGNLHTNDVGVCHGNLTLDTVLVRRQLYTTGARQVIPYISSFSCAALPASAGSQPGAARGSGAGAGAGAGAASGAGAGAGSGAGAGAASSAAAGGAPATDLRTAVAAGTGEAAAGTDAAPGSPGTTAATASSQARASGSPGAGDAPVLHSDTAVAAVARDPRYTAPEVLAGGPATRPADMYSVGVMLLQAFTNVNREAVAMDGECAEIPSSVDATVADLLGRLLPVDPSKRFNVRRACFHDTFVAMAPTATRGAGISRAEKLADLRAATAAQTKLTGTYHIDVTTRRVVVPVLLAAFGRDLEVNRLLRQPLMIQIADERAYDYGGVQRDCFTTLFNTLAAQASSVAAEGTEDPEVLASCMLETRNRQAFLPNPKYRFTRHFVALGRIMARMLLDDVPVPPIFARSFFKRLLPKPERVAFDDLREFDPELFTTLTNNVLRVTVTAEYADAVCLDFDEIEYDSEDEDDVADLAPAGGAGGGAGAGAGSGSGAAGAAASSTFGGFRNMLSRLGGSSASATSTAAVASAGGSRPAASRPTGAVTEANKAEYLLRRAQTMLVVQRKAQMKAIARGFHEVGLSSVVRNQASSCCCLCVSCLVHTLACLSFCVAVVVWAVSCACLRRPTWRLPLLVWQP